MKTSYANIPYGKIIHIGLFYLFYFSTVGVYIVFMPKLLKSYGLDATDVGIIYASGPFMRFLLPFAFRHFLHLSHNVYKIALVVGFLSAMLMLLVLDSFWAFLFANLIFGASAGVILPFVDTIALQNISKEHYGKARLWGSMGFIATALALGSLLHNPYGGIVALGIDTLLTLVFGFGIIKYDSNIQKEDSPKKLNQNFSLVKYWAFWVSTFLLQVSFGGFYNFFTIYEADHSIPIQTIGYLWSFGVICEIIIFYFQAPLLKKDPLSLLKLTTASAVIRWGLLYLYPGSIIMTYISQSLHAFSFALYYTTVISYTYQLYSQKKLAQQFLLGLSFGLGGSVGAALAGWIYDIDSSMLFGFEAIVAALSLGFIYLHQIRKEYIYAKEV